MWTYPIQCRIMEVGKGLGHTAAGEPPVIIVYRLMPLEPKKSNGFGEEDGESLSENCLKEDK